VGIATERATGTGPPAGTATTTSFVEVAWGLPVSYVRTGDR